MEIKTPAYKGHFFFIPQHERAYNWTRWPKKMSKRVHWNAIKRVADSFYVPPAHADAIKQEIVDAGFTWEMKEDEANPT